MLPPPSAAVRLLGALADGRHLRLEQPSELVELGLVVHAKLVELLGRHLRRDGLLRFGNERGDVRRRRLE